MIGCGSDATENSRSPGLKLTELNDGQREVEPIERGRCGTSSLESANAYSSVSQYAAGSRNRPNNANGKKIMGKIEISLLANCCMSMS